jgi:hypothetical protein
MQKQRIYWDDHEREKLTEQVASAIMSHPGDTTLVVTNRVLSQWPPDRRRKLISTTSVPWLQPGIDKWFKNAKENLHKLNTQTPPPIPPAPEIPTPEEILGNIPLEKLIETLINRITEKLEISNQINRTNQDLLHRLLARQTQPIQPQTQTQTKPYICIIGARTAHIPEVKKQFEHKIKLHFIDAFISNHTLPNNVDKYLLMADHTRHDWLYLIKDRNKIQIVSGGLTSLIQTLTQIIK